MVFKAGKIRKYRMGANGQVEEKSLTIPIAPKLMTSDRAMLKEDLS